MQQERLADLDELVLRCRDNVARTHIEEALANYRVGAYRSCIVSTWIAVVYDYIHKLRDLDLSGDKLAKQKLEEFEDVCRKHDVSGFLVPTLLRGNPYRARQYSHCRIWHLGGNFYYAFPRRAWERGDKGGY